MKKVKISVAFWPSLEPSGGNRKRKSHSLHHLRDYKSKEGSKGNELTVLEESSSTVS